MPRLVLSGEVTEDQRKKGTGLWCCLFKGSDITRLWKARQRGTPRSSVVSVGSVDSVFPSPWGHRPTCKQSRTLWQRAVS